MSPTNQTNVNQTDQDDKARIYWINAVTPLHVGAGRGIGFIDLPIVRETVSGFPYVPGSSVKGVLADHHGVTLRSRTPNSLHSRAFGRADAEGENANSGALVFTDARLVCLPVKSLYGTFAWCTAPIVLSRLQRDMKMGKAHTPPPDIPEIAEASSLLVPRGIPSKLVADQRETPKMAYFEDLDFTCGDCLKAEDWAKLISEQIFPGDTRWQELMKERFAVVHDDVFSFLSESATQVDARVQISDNTKTVGEGPWYEESLPAESILAGMAWCGPVFGNGDGADNASCRKEIESTFCTNKVHLQLGGKATIGRGQVSLTFSS